MYHLVSVSSLTEFMLGLFLYSLLNETRALEMADYEKSEINRAVRSLLYSWVAE